MLQLPTFPKKAYKNQFDTRQNSSNIRSRNLERLLSLEHRLLKDHLLIDFLPISFWKSFFIVVVFVLRELEIREFAGSIFAFFRIVLFAAFNLFLV